MDIVPNLLAAIQRDYERLIKESDTLELIRERIKKGTATYLDADKCAEEVAIILDKVYSNNITADILPNGRMYYNIAKRILEPTLRAAYEDVSEVVMQIQTLLNEKAGLGMKAIRADFNKDKVEGIINKLSNEEEYV